MADAANKVTLKRQLAGGVPLQLHAAAVVDARNQPPKGIIPVTRALPLVLATARDQFFQQPPGLVTLVMRADDTAVSVAFFLAHRREAARVIAVTGGAAVKPGLADERVAQVIFHLITRAVFIDQRDQAARQVIFIFHLMPECINARQRQAIRRQFPLCKLPLRVAPGGKALPAVKLKGLRRAIRVNNTQRQAILPVVYQRAVARRVNLLFQPAIFVIAESGGTPGTIRMADKKVGAVPGEALNTRRRIANAHQVAAIVVVIFRDTAQLIHKTNQVTGHVIGVFACAALHIGDAHRQVPAFVVVDARHLSVRLSHGGTVAALVVTVARDATRRVGHLRHLPANVATEPGIAASGVLIGQKLMVVVILVPRHAP